MWVPVEDLSPSWRSESQFKIWVPVKDLSPSWRFESYLKIRVPVEDSSSSLSYESKSKIHIEVTIEQLENCTISNPKLNLNRTHAKKPTPITQQKREEPNAAETINIWKTE